MKFLLTSLACASVLFFACKKPSNSDTDATKHPPGVATSPETKPQYDNTSFGVYKGVVIGSSGFVIIRVNNGDNTIKGFLTIDALKDTLSTTQTLTAGQPIRNLPLTGRISTMTLSANADGSDAEIKNLTIAGHPNAEALIFHENSTQQVLMYEGTMSGAYTGKINIVKAGTDPKSTPVHLLMKVKDENYYHYGWSAKDTSSSGYSHFFWGTVPFGSGPSGRQIDGNFNCTLSEIKGVYSASAYGVTPVRGTFVCKRTY